MSDQRDDQASAAIDVGAHAGALEELRVRVAGGGLQDDALLDVVRDAGALLSAIAASGGPPESEHSQWAAVVAGDTVTVAGEGLLVSGDATPGAITVMSGDTTVTAVALTEDGRARPDPESSGGDLTAALGSIGAGPGLESLASGPVQVATSTGGAKTADWTFNVGAPVDNRDRSASGDGVTTAASDALERARELEGGLFEQAESGAAGSAWGAPGSGAGGGGWAGPGSGAGGGGWTAPEGAGGASGGAWDAPEGGPDADGGPAVAGRGVAGTGVAGVVAGAAAIGGTIAVRALSARLTQRRNERSADPTTPPPPPPPPAPPGPPPPPPAPPARPEDDFDADEFRVREPAPSPAPPTAVAGPPPPPPPPSPAASGPPPPPPQPTATAAGPPVQLPASSPAPPPASSGSAAGPPPPPPQPAAAAGPPPPPPAPAASTPPPAPAAAAPVEPSAGDAPAAARSPEPTVAAVPPVAEARPVLYWFSVDAPQSGTDSSQQVVAQVLPGVWHPAHSELNGWVETTVGGTVCWIPAWAARRAGT